MTGAEIIDMKSGRLKEDQIVKLVADRMSEHDFDIESPLELDVGIILDIVRAWGKAMSETAVPSPTGER